MLYRTIRLVAPHGAEETTFLTQAARSPHSRWASEFEVSERRFSKEPQFLGERALPVGAKQVCVGSL
jgi:hypothetical protein